MARPASLFERLISRPRHSWLAPLVVLLLLLVQIVEGVMGGELAPSGSGAWRGIVVAPAVMLYILVVSPWLDRMGIAVLDSLRPLVILPEEEFDRLVDRLGRLRARDEVIVILLGLALGAVIVVRGRAGVLSWLELTWGVATALQYGLLVWTIFAAISSTRVSRALLNQRLRIDPLDASPFEAIGRQSLILGLVFVGGFTLGLLITLPDAAVLVDPRFWLTYVPMGLIPIVVFFLNMQPTHQVLLAARKQELERVQRRIHATCHALMRPLDGPSDVHTLAPRLQALTAYEHRLNGARTWPYDTSMLRTLFFSILVPGATLVGKLLTDRFFE